MKVAGTAFVKVDGQQLALGESLSLDPTSIEREGVVGVSGPVGFRSTIRAADIAL